MLANCNKILDDSQSTMSYYFNLCKSENLPGVEESDQLDFSSPASINAFLKKTFGQLTDLDIKEQVESDSDRISS